MSLLEALVENPNPIWCEDCRHFVSFSPLCCEGECDIDGHDTYYGQARCESFEPKGRPNTAVSPIDGHMD